MNIVYDESIGRCFHARGARPVTGPGPTTRGTSNLCLLARDAELVEVVERTEHRVVRDITGDRVVPDEDVRQRVERQRDHVLGLDAVRFLAELRLPGLVERPV